MEEHTRSTLFASPWATRIVFGGLFLNKNRILLSLSIDAHGIHKIKFSSCLQHLGIIKEFTKESTATEVYI